MQFTSATIFFALLAILSTALSTVASPVMLLKRDVILPHITSPKGGEVFQAGKTITVTWDTSVVGDSKNVGMIVLAQPTKDGNEHLQLDPPLASGFPLSDGSRKVTFPKDLPTGHNYAVVLFGDSGNISKQFTIKACD